MQPRLPGKEPTDRRVIVLVVLLVLSLAITTLWAREGDSGPLHSVRRGISVVTTPFTKTGRWLFTPVRSVGLWVANMSIDRDEVDTLRSQNEELRTRVMQLEEGRLEAARLRELLQMSDPLELDSVGARVIGGSDDAWTRAITIDKGSRDGLSIGMPVLSKDGLLGQIVEVGPDSARVRLITDQRSGVAVIVQATRAEGVVRGTLDDSLSLEYVEDDNEIAPGDVIITSGTGGVFPKGLVVGEVVSVGEVGESIYRRIAVRPAATTAGIEEVVVIVGRIASEASEAPAGAEMAVPDDAENAGELQEEGGE